MKTERISLIVSKRQAARRKFLVVVADWDGGSWYSNYRYYWGHDNECIDCPNGSDDFLTLEEAEETLQMARKEYPAECCWIEQIQNFR